MAVCDDERLIASAALGDRASFAALFTLYAPKIKAYMRRLGVGDAAAEDLAQEAMLRVWRRASQFDPERGSAAAWIYTIARNAHIDAVRKERHPAELKHDLAREPSKTPEDALLESDQMRRARHAVAELSSSQGQVCDLVLLRGKSLRHAAERLGLTMPTTKTHLRRGLAKLKASMKEAF